MYINNETRYISRTLVILVIFCIIQVLLFTFISYGITMKIAPSIDVNSYKRILNINMPLIDSTYNSGKINFSIGSEISKAISAITGVDMSDPFEIFNFKNPTLTNYYPVYLSNQIHNEDDQSVKPNNPSDVDYTGEKYIVHRAEGNNALSISYYLDDDYHDESSIEYKGDNISYAKGDIVIKNNSGLNIDIESIVKEPFYNKFVGTNGPQILIYHTHTTESYISDIKEFDDKTVPSFSTNNNRNVVRVGHELDKLLTEKYGFKTIHNASQHHYPSSKAYDNSRKTVENIIAGNPSIKLSIDVHRDGLAKDQGKLRLVQKVNGKECAKLMFVVGTDASASNPRWEDNLRLAILLQERIEEKAPGLMRHISIRSGRYNQDIAENALLVECGGDGNTIEEVKESLKYLAEAIDYVMGIK